MKAIVLILLVSLSAIAQEPLGGFIQNKKNGYQIFSVCDAFDESNLCEEFSFYEVPGKNRLIKGRRVNKNSLRFADVEAMFEENQMEPVEIRKMFSKSPHVLSWSKAHAEFFTDSEVGVLAIVPRFGSSFVVTFLADMFIKAPGVLVGELFRVGFQKLDAGIKAGKYKRRLKKNITYVDHALENTSKIKRLSHRKYQAFKQFIKKY